MYLLKLCMTKKSNTRTKSPVIWGKLEQVAEPAECAAPTCRLLHVSDVVCSSTSRPVAPLFRGLTAATAEHSAAFLFWPGLTWNSGFTTDGFTFSLGLTEDRTRAVTQLVESQDMLHYAAKRWMCLYVIVCLNDVLLMMWFCLFTKVSLMTNKLYRQRLITLL